MSTPKIVVDTNVLVAAALSIQSKRPNSPSVVLFSKIATRDVIAVASPQMLYELAGKLSNSSFGLPSTFVIDIIKLLSDAVEMVSIRGLDMGCRDERDNIFIETAYNGLPVGIVRVVPEAGLKGLKKSLRNGAREFGGRDPESPVIDLSLGAIYGSIIPKIGLASDDHNETPCLTSDNVKPTVKTLGGFPYLTSAI